MCFVIGAYVFNINLAIELNNWNGRFYNALQVVDKEAIYRALFDFIWLCATIIVVLVTANYAQNRLALAARRDLTAIFLKNWLSKEGTIYHLQQSRTEPDNPDQRIAEDIKELINLSLSLAISLFNALLTCTKIPLCLIHGFTSLGWCGIGLHVLHRKAKITQTMIKIKGGKALFQLGQQIQLGNPAKTGQSLRGHFKLKDAFVFRIDDVAHGSQLRRADLDVTLRYNTMAAFAAEQRAGGRRKAEAFRLILATFLTADQIGHEARHGEQPQFKHRLDKVGCAFVGFQQMQTV